MIKSIFNHFPKDLLLGYSHNTLGLVHSFSNKKELPSEKQPVLEFAKQKQLVDDAQQTPKSKQETSQLKKAPKNIVFGKRKINKFPKDKQLIRELIQLQKNQQKKSTRILGIAGLIVTVVGLYLTYQSTGYAFEGLHFTSKSDKRQEEKTDEYKWGKLREQHLKDFEKKTDFVDGKSVENQIRSIFQQQNNRIDLILGVQGIGKTSAAKQLIREKRQKAKKKKKRERIYYYSLRSEQQQIDPKDNSSIVQIQKMVQLIKAINSQYDGSVPTTFVIDDINKLEDQKDKLTRQRHQDQIIKLNRRGVKVILISSSTGFYHNIWVNELFRKYMNKKQHIIWMMSESQAKQIHQKRASQLNIDQKVVEKVISFGLPLRKSLALLASIPEWKIKQQQEVMKELENRLKKLKKLIGNSLEEVLLNKMDQRISCQILRGLTKNTTHLDVQTAHQKNCLDLYEKVNKLQNSALIPSIAIKEMDKENLIIMCYPRSRLIMKVFEEKLQQLEKELNK